jgi:hypothetical protein
VVDRSRAVIDDDAIAACFLFVAAETVAVPNAETTISPRVTRGPAVVFSTFCRDAKKSRLSTGPDWC